MNIWTGRTACVKKGITMSFALTREGIKPVAKGFALALALFQIWFTTGFGVLDGSMMRVMFVSFITVLVFLFIPCRKYKENEKEPTLFLLIDLCCAGLAIATAVYFGLMAVYGTTTHKDLTGWGPRLMMALVAMIITGFVGMLFGFGFGGSVLYCGIGLVVFMLLTAYDTQKLQQMYSYYSADAEMAEKASIYGALTLYLDFINIFLYVVRLLGMNSRSRNN